MTYVKTGQEACPLAQGQIGSDVYDYWRGGC